MHFQSQISGKLFAGASPPTSSARTSTTSITSPPATLVSQTRHTTTESSLPIRVSTYWQKFWIFYITRDGDDILRCQPLTFLQDHYNNGGETRCRMLRPRASLSILAKVWDLIMLMDNARWGRRAAQHKQALLGFFYSRYLTLWIRISIPCPCPF